MGRIAFILAVCHRLANVARTAPRYSLALCICLQLGAILTGTVAARAESLSLDQSFEPNEFGTWVPLATIDPGDVISGTLTIQANQFTSSSAYAQIAFNGSGANVGFVASTGVPGDQTHVTNVILDSHVTALPPTLYDWSFGDGFSSYHSTYPNGGAYPRGTAPPVFGISVLPGRPNNVSGPSHVTFSGEITRANPDRTPGEDFLSRAPTGTGTPPEQFPSYGPPTVQQFAALAQDSYLPTPHIETTVHYHSVQTVSGDYGFSARVYQSYDGSQIVIAPRGTSHWADREEAYTLLADASFLAGTPTIPLVEEVKQLAAVVRDVAQQIQPGGSLYTLVENCGEAGCEEAGPQLSLTGYSLGGALAQIVGAAANVQTVTFLSPGAKQLDLHLEVPEVNSLAALGIDSPSHGIWDYRQWGDLVSLAGDQLGLTITNDNPYLDPFEKTPLGAPTLAGHASSGWGNFHSLDLLRQTLASAPTIPGLAGPQQVFGAPDAWLLNTLIVVPFATVKTIFEVPGRQKDVMTHFDPQPGYGYSLVVDPTSPEIGFLRLPVGGDVAGWSVTVFSQGAEIETLTSLTGEFSFTSSFDRIDFHPLDTAGMPTFYPEPYFFSLRFNEDGDFRATLETVPGFDGDYNHDGAVDAADYVMWRKYDGTQSIYDTWRANFGRTIGSGSVASAPVPEPSMLAMLCACILVTCMRRAGVHCTPRQVK
jgi:hypothetical protein